MSSANSDNPTCFFPFRMPFISFFAQFPELESMLTMLTRNGKSGNSCPISD